MKETFHDLSLDDLRVKREELKKKLVKVRFDAIVGDLDNPMEKRLLRRKIARVNTMIWECRHGRKSGVVDE